MHWRSRPILDSAITNARVRARLSQRAASCLAAAIAFGFGGSTANANPRHHPAGPQKSRRARGCISDRTRVCLDYRGSKNILGRIVRELSTNQV